MDIHKQKCQNCQSTHMENYISRESGKPDQVYIQCKDCSELVALYTLSAAGYYHHHKGFESYLRALQRSGELLNSPKFQKEFDDLKANIVTRFQKILQQYKEK